MMIAGLGVNGSVVVSLKHNEYNHEDESILVDQ